MEIKQIFSKNKKKIISGSAALLMLTLAVFSALNQNNSAGKNELNASILSATAGSVSQTEQINEPVYERELQNSVTSLWRAIQSAAGVNIDQGLTTKNGIPLDSTIACTADRTSIPWDRQVVYEAKTSTKIGFSNIVWATFGSMDYQRMYSTDEFTATLNWGAEKKVAIIKSGIFWRDNGVLIASADCPDITVTEPLHNTQEYTGGNERVDLSVIDEDILTPEQNAKMFQQVTGQTQEESSDKPPATAASDTLQCRIFYQELILSEKKPIRIDCSLYQTAIVSAQIIKGDYQPPEPPAAESVVASLLDNKISKPRPFYLTWNGLNNFDEPVKEGDYTFVVEAKLTANSKADYSIQKFKFFLEPPVETQETQQAQQTEETQTQGTAANVLTREEPAGTQSAEPGAEASSLSKCPGINYPLDIAGHWAESIIKAAYDECIVKGADAEHFYPDIGLTRAEAVKTAILAAGKPPNIGCYDADCGTPFTDLEMWQGPWIKAAYDAHIVSGLSENKFSPDSSITRAESAALTAKTFGIPPHAGCYTANCGAGYPDNIFNDIRLSWQGPWIRALWDKQLISGIAPNQFAPDKPITRAEFVKLVMSAKK